MHARIERSAAATFVLGLAAAACLGGGGSASAAVIGAQDFNRLAPATFTGDSLPSGSQLTNFGSVNTNPFLGLTFETFWFDTRGVGTGPVVGGESGDFIGVNDFGGFNAPDVGPGGTPVGGALALGEERNYEFNDGDGRVELVFQALDLSGFSSRRLSFDYWINDTGYEPEDSLVATLSDGVMTETLLELGEAGLEDNASADDGSANWRSLDADVEALIAAGFSELVTLTISVDNNAATENVFVDNVAFTGEVPEPATLALAALGLAGGLARRR